MNKIQKLFLSLASLLLTIWLFGLVWSASSFASDNIMNAVEASAPDTVTPEIWMEITFGTLGLVAAFSALTNTIPLKIFSIFRWWEKPLVFWCAPIRDCSQPSTRSSHPLVVMRFNHCLRYVAFGENREGAIYFTKPRRLKVSA